MVVFMIHITSPKCCGQGGQKHGPVRNIEGVHNLIPRVVRQDVKSFKRHVKLLLQGYAYAALVVQYVVKPHISLISRARYLVGLVESDDTKKGMYYVYNLTSHNSVDGFALGTTTESWFAGRECLR